MKRKTQNRRKCRACRGQGGFTLIEIIVTIVIAAIMGVFFVQFVTTNVIHSADPVRQAQNLSSATHIMESMTWDYKYLASTQSEFLKTFKDHIEKGKKGTTRPAGYPEYGIYDIVYNKYIQFRGVSPFNPNGIEEDDPDQSTGRVLKVTIRCGDQTVTALFTR